MGFKFTKMHGLGNDFMVVDAIHQSIDLTPATIAALSRRDTGVGFDQCLLIEASRESGVDFFYRIFNANGQEVGQCGNGARCLARFARKYGLTKQHSITVATHTTRMQLHINQNNTVTVNIGTPKLKPACIPLNAATQAPLYALSLSDKTTCELHAVSVGNPHAVMVVTDVTHAPVHKMGQLISEHASFPEQTNVGFMQIVSPKHIKLRVYERGCGETQACGSGAVAAVAIGRLFHDLAEEVTVSLPGGELSIGWPNIDGPIYLTGPATFVYEGIVLD